MVGNQVGSDLPRAHDMHLLENNRQLSVSVSGELINQSSPLLWMLLLAAVCSFASVTAAENVASTGDSIVSAAQNQAAEQVIYIREYRVLGARELPRIQVEEAVYPFLGPGRTPSDVE